MEPLDINHRLFKLILQEHQLILEKLEAINPHNPQKDLLEWHLEFSENFHHKKEEVILFKEILKNPKISEGGPMCTLYYDLFMNDRPLTKLQKITGLKVIPEDHQKEFFITSSPLQVPIEEHQTTKTIISYLLKNWEALSTQNRSDLYTNYLEIQRLHIEKENTCLLPMCTQLLNTDKADELALLWESSQFF